MSENTIYIKKYFPKEDNNDFHINEKEIWRYSGYPEIPSDDEIALKEEYNQMIKELQGNLSYKVCYRRMKIHWENDFPILPFESNSINLAKALNGSDEVIIFAATIGYKIDQLIARYQHLRPTKALLMQAYGAERVECLCNAFCNEIELEVCKNGLSCTRRFSPGYGDFSIDNQKAFFSLLDCSRKIGVSLNDSLLMTPSKSVSAIIGVGKDVPKPQMIKCAYCTKYDCEYRGI